jgi:rhodanese-related sulfurtransferase
VVVDVRQAHEWAGGHIPNAQLIEAGELPNSDRDIARDRLVATHCAHGQRAATAMSILEQRGYEHLALIPESVDDWCAAGGQLQHGISRQPSTSLSA